jgi:hypothetical protein
VEPFPRLVVTAYASSGDQSATEAAGYQAHVAKPFEPAEIARLVARLTAPRRDPVYRNALAAFLPVRLGADRSATSCLDRYAGFCAEFVHGAPEPHSGPRRAKRAKRDCRPVKGSAGISRAEPLTGSHQPLGLARLRMAGSESRARLRGGTTRPPARHERSRVRLRATAASPV